MATTAEDSRSSALERSWWLRAPAVLLAPHNVFVALRDDSEEAGEERQEPLGALLALAGISGVLGSPVARTMLNEGASSWVIPVWAFVGGVFYALGVYWLGGGLVFGAARRFGGLGSYRRARSIVALAAAPLALTLFTLWPVRIAIYGNDLFRSWKYDLGPGDRIFSGLFYGAFGWSLLLLVIGVRAVHGWSWGRSAATVALAASLPVLIVVGTHFAH